MRFAILNDETIETWNGGAALVNDKICKSLISAGHECKIYAYNGKAGNIPTPKEVNEIDYFIFANIAYYPEDFLYRIMESKTFATFRHDIPVILYTQPPSIRFERFYKLFDQMFTKAKVSFFISPMQYKVFQFNFKLGKSVILPPPLNIDGFTNENNPYRKGSLYVGDISHARGCVETLAFMKRKDHSGPYTFVGSHIDHELVEMLKKEGATVLSPVSHNDIKIIMNEHSDLYYFPQIYDSFCLKILEAHICGMNIIADNYRIGLYSFNTDIDNLIEGVKTKSMEAIIMRLLEKDEDTTGNGEDITTNTEDSNRK